MEVLQTLAVALGLAGLSGYSLYLTVLASGLAIRFEWIHLTPQYATLSVLAHPAILITAGILFAIEFLVDKIPWADSIWDAIHTVIRPLGAAFLAIQTIGHPNMVFSVITGLLAAFFAFVGHSLKSSSHLMVNQSPEPFSNIALSSAENVGLAGTLFLLWKYPVPTFIGLLLLFAIALYYMPKIWRSIRIRLWFVLNKLNQPARNGANQALPEKLPSKYETVLRRHYPPSLKLHWAVRCISGKSKRIESNRFGYLAAIDGPKLIFVTQSWIHSKLIEIAPVEVNAEPKFLYDELSISTPDKNVRYRFKFDRSRSNLAAKIATNLKDQSDDRLRLLASGETIDQQDEKQEL
jgi:hypothetical protein